jgi:hypothetical protein
MVLWLAMGLSGFRFREIGVLQMINGSCQPEHHCLTRTYSPGVEDPLVFSPALHPSIA